MTVRALTPGGAALVGLMDRYLAGLLDPFVSLLEVHRLMYFMQEAGEPLELSLTKVSYGPYAENLRHVLHEIEGVFVSGYGDGGMIRRSLSSCARVRWIRRARNSRRAPRRELASIAWPGSWKASSLRSGSSRCLRFTGS